MVTASSFAIFVSSSNLLFPHEAHGLTGLTSAAAENEPAKETEFIGSAVQFFNGSTAAGRALHVPIDFSLIRINFLECAAALVASILLYFHYVSPLALISGHQPFGQLSVLLHPVDEYLVHHLTGITDFRVAEAIINTGSFLPELDNSFVPEDSQVAGYNRLGELEHPRQFAYGGLAPPQLIDNDKSPGVGECLA
jgi:hypothetical protein